MDKTLAINLDNVCPFPQLMPCSFANVYFVVKGVLDHLKIYRFYAGLMSHPGINSGARVNHLHHQKL